ncbi:MAG: aminotransferase class V-fold PLP-dependent enzyme [Candidatus Pacebacteria bacterium]|nr:aminotransferase class V-fold PLP-dependent enzyme [Candidatus Paceibacterota bacterium]
MIKLVKSTFYKEKETKESLAKFILNTEIMSMGDECKKFETAFAKKQKRKYALLVSSGSMANQVLIQSVMNRGLLKKGDKVAVSALTWATNIMPLLQLGLEPVILDVDIATFNVSSVELEKHIKGIKAFFITNVLGLCGDMSEIKKVCDKHNVLLLEDNCESLGSEIDGKLLGNFGLASTFSFFVGHHLSTIEGGMICTDDDDLYNMLVMVRAHGWDRNLAPETQQKLRKEAGCDDFYAKYTFYDLAYNARPTEITGFLGNSQLPYLDEMITKRVSNFKRFAEAVNANDDFMKIDHAHINAVSNMAMPIVCKTPEKAEIYKKKFAGAVEIRPVIAGNMLNQPFYKKYVHSSATYPNTDFVHQNGFYFANNAELTEEEVDLIVALLNK